MHKASTLLWSDLPLAAKSIALSQGMHTFELAHWVCHFEIVTKSIFLVENQDSVDVGHVSLGLTFDCQGHATM